jgi:hypothetical protein
MSRVYLTNEKPTWDATAGKFMYHGNEVFVDTEHALCPAAAWPMSEGAGSVAHRLLGCADATATFSLPGGVGAWSAACDTSFVDGEYTLITKVQLGDVSGSYRSPISISGGAPNYSSLAVSVGFNRVRFSTRYTSTDQNNVEGANGQISANTAYTIAGSVSSAQKCLYVNGVLKGFVNADWRRDYNFTTPFGSSGLVTTTDICHWVLFYAAALDAAGIAAVSSNPWQWLYYNAGGKKVYMMSPLQGAMMPIGG